ncbi:MAG: adenosylcobalamin-dependent ribonucleoside-diphosphate reductase [Candidatus Woesearchaeota archaeon]|nr:adenosylcobalamin-dependent ribonucleoside-diphosphate reductase [Candidatus Woesearchaeota archaeon]
MNKGSIREVIKRDGSVVKFDKKKIENAIFKALVSVGKVDKKFSQAASEKVIEVLEKTFTDDEFPTVEQIQDIVEITLIKLGEASVAKEYILYRKEREKIRDEKKGILNKQVLDDIDKEFDTNGLRVLASRYLRKNSRGEIIESPRELFSRCAINDGIGDLIHDKVLYDREKKQGIRALEKDDSINEASLKRYYEEKISIGRYPLNENHIETLKRTYALLNSEGKMRKSFSEIISMLKSGELSGYENEISKYFTLMTKKKFMPNTPALANFGNVHGMGSACFVLDIGDSMESIMSTLKDAAIIFKAGGGCGYNFSKLRPTGDLVKSTSGVASGPISFMTLYDKMTEVISQGGIRRGANMGILNVDHPDIELFIKAKEGNAILKNFNISVLLTSEFWECYSEKKPFPLRNPRDRSVLAEVNPVNLFDNIAYEARNFAEPGLLFMDNINKRNPTLKALGPIVTTNPCGEVLLYPDESCNLGSINVYEFVITDAEGKKKVDWDEMAETVRIGTRFLDNINDINNFPFDKIREMTRKSRKIGLGVMGVGDLLYELGIRYDSEEGLSFMEELMEFINFHSKLASIELSKERGAFPLFSESSYAEGEMGIEGFYERKNWRQDWKRVSEGIRKYGLRNAFTTVIAPTGSISMIANTSSGIEPLFSIVFEKRVVVGNFYYVNRVFEKEIRNIGLYNPLLLERIADNSGSIQNIVEIPETLKNVFVTSSEISPEMHVRAQAAFQKWVDSSISKTINMPGNATMDDVKSAYILAHNLGCKGITVYRDGSIETQVLNAGKKQKKDFQIKHEQGDEEQEKGESCPICGAVLKKEEGCATCSSCGWCKCSSS